MKSARLTFVVLLAISLAFGWRPLLATLTLALRNDQYTHILLILPVSLALIFLESPFLESPFLEWPSPKEMSTPNTRAGFVFLAIAVLAAIFTVVRSATLPQDVQLSIRMFALVLFWIGTCIVSLGSRAARALLFPLCFLFWLVPFPSSLLNAVVTLLQQGSSLTAHALFSAVGVPVSQDGVVLNIPGLTVEVSQECSSIRSSSMLLVTTMVLAQVLLRSPWRKALVIAVAIPLSIAKNGLRVFTISMLGTHVDPGYLTGRLHHQGGIIFFMIALATVFLLIWILRRGEDSDVPGAALLPASLDS
ncbi:MAG: exosortase/archaeosortase family protein [Terriglobales bacterium]